MSHSRFARTILVLLSACSGTDRVGTTNSLGGSSGPSSATGGANVGGSGTAGGVLQVGGSSVQGSIPAVGGTTTEGTITAPATGGVFATGGTNATFATGGISAAGGTTGGGGSNAVALPPQLTWKRESTFGAVQKLWGSSASDIYAVGMSGDIRHSSGDGKWVVQDPGTSANITGVWGSGPNDIYASVESNFILHSTGDGTWAHQAYRSGYTFEDIWGSGPNDIYVVRGGASRSAGDGSWSYPPQTITSGPPVLGIWGSSATDIYVVTAASNGRTIFHSTGDGSWRAQTSPDVASMEDIFGVDAQHVYAGGNYYVLFSSGDGNWTTQLTATATIQAVWAPNSDAAYACDSLGNFYRSNGHGQWSTGEPIDSSLNLTCLAIWGTSPDSIYVGVNGGIYHGTP